MARYVCKCGGHNTFCTTCWGARYYTPEVKGHKKEEIPAPRTELPLETEAETAPLATTEETESTDASA